STTTFFGTGAEFGTNNFYYRSRFEIYGLEAQHLLQAGDHSLVFGARGQLGTFDTRSFQSNPTGPLDVVLPFAFPTGVMSDQRFKQDFYRLSLYAYDNWRLADSLLVVAGLGYDRLRMPENFRNPPLNPRDENRQRLSPKAGLLWTPWKD